MGRRSDYDIGMDELRSALNALGDIVATGDRLRALNEVYGRLLQAEQRLTVVWERQVAAG